MCQPVFPGYRSSETPVTTLDRWPSDLLSLGACTHALSARGPVIGMVKKIGDEKQNRERAVREWLKKSGDSLEAWLKDAGLEEEAFKRKLSCQLDLADDEAVDPAAREVLGRASFARRRADARRFCWLNRWYLARIYGEAPGQDNKLIEEGVAFCERVTVEVWPRYVGKAKAYLSNTWRNKLIDEYRQLQHHEHEEVRDEQAVNTAGVPFEEPRDDAVHQIIVEVWQELPPEQRAVLCLKVGMGLDPDGIRWIHEQRQKGKRRGKKQKEDLTSTIEAVTQWTAGQQSTQQPATIASAPIEDVVDAIGEALQGGTGLVPTRSICALLYAVTEKDVSKQQINRFDQQLARARNALQQKLQAELAERDLVP